MVNQIDYPLWVKLLTALFAIFLLYGLVRIIKANPGSFSRDNLSKSFFTMGILAIILFGIIGTCIWFLRH